MDTISLIQLLNPQNIEIDSLLGDYAGEKNRIFRLVPLQFMKDHIDDELRGQFDLCSKEIVEIIDETKAAGEFPYNSTIEEKVNAKYGLCGKALSLFVYCSQSYVHLRDAIMKALKTANELKANGFTPLLELEQHIGQKFRFVAKTTNLLGGSGLKELRPHKLIKDAAGHFFFIARTGARRGIYANPGVYVKAY